MKAFVTGANGFIGRALTQRLLQNGFEVIALVRKNSKHIPPGIKIVTGDILDIDSLKNTTGYGCDRLYHLAAMITFDPNRREELLKVNGQGTSNILEAASQWKIDKTVVVSSACTIGISNSKNIVLDENTPFNEKLAKANPYLESKILTEKIAKEASKKQSVIIVNPTTVYGPGDWSLNSGTLVAQTAKSKMLPVPPGGSNVIDIDDLVDGIISAGEKGTSGKRYILSGENLLFKDIFTTIAEVIGNKPIYIPIPALMRSPMAGAAGFAGFVLRNRFITSQIVNDLFKFKYYSNELAKKELNWRPRGNFKSTIGRAWKFYKQEKLI
ncbi:MAG: NAD-dependent epimerase/dehydratase family protein [Elusimicrobia bacterium]|nr:NAD-dependent epimerase/dehydratase family protein [Elusimicrobiota bacterium]